MERGGETRSKCSLPFPNLPNYQIKNELESQKKSEFIKSVGESGALEEVYVKRS